MKKAAHDDEKSGNLAKPGSDFGGEAAGLVSSKTSGHTNKFLTASSSVSFASPVVAERRVKRLKKSVWASGHLHPLAEDGHRPAQCWFVTLTYVGVNDWCANHMSESLRLYRNWCKRIGVPCRYTWVAELQSRGAVHYHLLAWLPRHVVMPKWDRPKGKRHAFWPHGMTNTQKSISGVGYLMKYLSKLGELTKFPKGLRLYGIGGLTKQGRDVRSWLNLPEWCKRSYGVGEVVRKKFGLLVRATGEILAPAYAAVHIPGGLLIQALRDLPERFHHGAYSTVKFN